MARGLDHIVHGIRDLDQGAETYRRLGFTVGARNRHPWGTQNHVVQLPGFFVELLSLGESRVAPSVNPRHFSFAGFMSEQLAHGEGLAMLVLESGDAAADQRAFEAAGISSYDVFRFERDAARPDGTPTRVGFSLAFATDPRSPQTGFFVCQQHFPENFWNPAFQQHANTAEAVAGVVLVADNPSDHHIFLSTLAGVRDMQATSTGITIETPRGTIQVMDPSAFRAHFGVEPPQMGEGARLAALRFAVRDPAHLGAVLESNAVPASTRAGRIVVPPDAAHGATIVFEPK